MNATVQKSCGRLIVVGAGRWSRWPRRGVADAAGTPAPAPCTPAARRTWSLPDLSTVDFRGINGRTLLMGGLVVCALGLLFGLMTFTQLKNLPVHASMLEVSELIYETCKTYLITQGKFILLLEVVHRVIMVFLLRLVLEPVSEAVADARRSSCSSA